MMVMILNDEATTVVAVVEAQTAHNQMHVYPLYRKKGPMFSNNKVPSPPSKRRDFDYPRHSYPRHRQRKVVKEGDDYDPDIFDSVFQEQGTILFVTAFLFFKKKIFLQCVWKEDSSVVSFSSLTFSL
jgi:hypothetical protein